MPFSTSDSHSAGCRRTGSPYEPHNIEIAPLESVDGRRLRGETMRTRESSRTVSKGGMPWETKVVMNGFNWTYDDKHSDGRPSDVVDRTIREREVSHRVMGMVSARRGGEVGTRERWNVERRRREEVAGPYTRWLDSILTGTERKL